MPRRSKTGPAASAAQAQHWIDRHGEHHLPLPAVRVNDQVAQVGRGGGGGRRACDGPPAGVELQPRRQVVPQLVGEWRRPARCRRQLQCLDRRARRPGLVVHIRQSHRIVDRRGEGGRHRDVIGRIRSRAVVIGRGVDVWKRTGALPRKADRGRDDAGGRIELQPVRTPDHVVGDRPRRRPSLPAGAR